MTTHSGTVTVTYKQKSNESEEPPWHHENTYANIIVTPLNPTFIQ